MNLKHFLPKFMSELKFESDYDLEFVINYEEEGSFVILDFSLDLDVSITEALSDASAYLENTHNLVLESFSKDDGFISQFRFPNEYKAAFIQYLTYFGKFLEDLGIQGDLSLRENDGLTYLSFRPQNGDVALSNIAAALSSYLSFPDGNSDFLVRPSKELESEVRFQQLASVVDHLKSQLKLSSAMLKLKEREISLLENHNSIRGPNTRLVSPIIKDYWEPIRGIRITSYKGKFFEINIPKLVELFSRSKKKP